MRFIANRGLPKRDRENGGYTGGVYARGVLLRGECHVGYRRVEFSDWIWTHTLVTVNYYPWTSSVEFLNFPSFNRQMARGITKRRGHVTYIDSVVHTEILGGTTIEMLLMETDET